MSKTIELKIIPGTTIKSLLAHPEQSLILPQKPDILPILRAMHETLIYWTEQLQAPAQMTPDLACRILGATYPNDNLGISKGSPLPVITKATSLLLWFNPKNYSPKAPDSTNMIQEDWISGGSINFIKKGESSLSGNIIIYDIKEQKRPKNKKSTTNPEQKYEAIKNQISI